MGQKSDCVALSARLQSLLILKSSMAMMIKTIKVAIFIAIIWFSVCDIIPPKGGDYFGLL